MGSMLRKYDEADMMQALSRLLLPGEEIIAAVYCAFQATGFWESVTAPSGNVMPGYVAVTDRNRLIGVKYKLLNEDVISLDLNHMTSLKIKNTLLSQKRVATETMADRKMTVKFQIAAKIVGANFPNHTENVQRLLDELNARQNQLP